VPDEVLRSYAILKAACARVNHSLGRLDDGRTAAIEEACREIQDGLVSFGGLGRHFPVDTFQTGSGTSTNMNANEVIANLVCVRRHKPIGSSKDAAYLKEGGVHPNDHVNMGQSSNDTFPTAMHIAAAVMIKNELLPAIGELATQLESHAKAWDSIVKIGRTHLQDATPIRLGQEFSGYAAQMRHAEERLHRALHALGELAIGGTAVGTGINCHEQFGSLVASELTRLTGIHFREAMNHFEAQHAKDAYVEASGHLKTIAVSLSKIANDIRWLGSGPRCGIGELVLPAVQPGSSIMPGKTNPVICEALIMVCCQVVGNDAAITMGGLGGIGSLLELNVAMPVIAERLIESIELLANASTMFCEKCLDGLALNEAEATGTVEKSLMMCTSLAPVIGYDEAAKVAKEAFKSGETVRQYVLRHKMVEPKRLEKLLDAASMTRPGGKGPGGG
jgi:fumarate hydratase class II